MFEQLKTKIEEGYENIIPEIIKLNPIFGTLENKLINKLIKIYREDTGKSPKDITATDFIEWYDMSGGMGNFILDFIDNFTLTDIVNLGKTDTKFIGAVKDVATSDTLRYATKDEVRDLQLEGDFRESSNKVTFPILIKWIFSDAAEADYSGGINPDIDPELLATMVDMVRDSYGKLTENLLEADEEVEDEISVEAELPIEEVEEPLPVEDTLIIDTTIPEVNSNRDSEDLKNAVCDMLRNLTQDFWQMISSVNSVMTTVDYEYKEEGADSIHQILDNIVDDLTINLGMLNKAVSTIDAKTLNLINKGEQVADKFLEN